MKRIFAIIITLLLAFSFVVSANAVQPVIGTPVDWNNPNAQVKFTPSKILDDMEPDSTLITFINNSDPTSKTYRIEIRKVSNYKEPVLCTDSSTNSKNESTNFYLSPNNTYSIKINSGANTLNIHGPDDKVVATFDLIEGFKNTNCFVYGECQVYPGGKISLIKNDNIVDHQNIPSEVVTNNNIPSDTEEKHTNAPRPIESKPANNEISDSNTIKESNKKDSSSALRIVCMVLLIILVLALIGFGVIMFLRYKNGKAKEERRKQKNNANTGAPSAPDSESAPRSESDATATTDPYNDPYEMEATQLPANDSDSSFTIPTQDVFFHSPKKAEPDSLFTSDKIDSRWTTASDTHLLDYAEHLFAVSPAIVSIDNPVVPSTMSGTTSPAASDTPVAPVESVSSVEPIEEKTPNKPSNDTYVFSKIYSSEDGIDLIRNTYGYDSVQFAEVSSDCLYNFSFGIFDKYHLSIDVSDFSSYVVIDNKLLVLNPYRFGKINNSVINGYFLNKNHPEIPFDFFCNNTPVSVTGIAKCSIESLIPAKIEKRDNVFVLVEKGKIFIRK